jgi:hypothetical protein
VVKNIKILKRKRKLVAVEDYEKLEVTLASIGF